MSQLSITKNICGSDQESNFMNATIQSCGELAVSIAVRLPESINGLSQDEIEARLSEDFNSLVSSKGYQIEVQIGSEE